MKVQDDENSHEHTEKLHRPSGKRGRRDRKGWTTSRVPDRYRLLRVAQTSPNYLLRSRSTRRINLNKNSPSASDPDAEVKKSSSKAKTSTSSAAPSELKRKNGSLGRKASLLDVRGEADTDNEGSTGKKQKKSHETSKSVGGAKEKPSEEITADREEMSDVKAKDEKQRQKKKEKRRKANKQMRNEEHRRLMEECARRAEVESSESRSFLVSIPLTRIGSLSGRSVCRHFRKNDLTMNDILPVTVEILLASLPAKLVYETLKGPIYFPTSCQQNVIQLKQRLGSTAVCSKLLVVSEEHFNEVILQEIAAGARPPRLLGQQTLVAIGQVLEDVQPPHELESSQNSEDKIKCLFKPILRSLGLEDTIITTGFSWKEKISLRSSVDLGTHKYAPTSDAAIIKLTSNKQAKILIVFEAYSRLGQSLSTPDENRADRVRLLIQGSYLSIRDRKPSVVFYLTRDKHMETILIFAEDEEQNKFGYYAEKQPFYNEVAWVDLICQIINLV